jgi:hypothetical protein
MMMLMIIFLNAHYKHFIAVYIHYNYYYYYYLSLLFESKGLCPSSCVLITRKHNIWGTGSVSVLRWRVGDTLLGLLERANLNHWGLYNCLVMSSYPLRHAVPRAMCWIGASHLEHIEVFTFTIQCGNKISIITNVFNLNAYVILMPYLLHVWLLCGHFMGTCWNMCTSCQCHIHATFSYKAGWLPS